jgi:hypothetical protein
MGARAQCPSPETQTPVDNRRRGARCRYELGPYKSCDLCYLARLGQVSAHESWTSLTCLTFLFRHRTESVTLYNLKFGLEMSYSVVYNGPLVGRMKILRGDLIVSHRPSRSRVHIVNYRTRAIAWLDNVQSDQSPPVCTVPALLPASSASLLYSHHLTEGINLSCGRIVP